MTFSLSSQKNVLSFQGFFRFLITSTFSCDLRRINKVLNRFLSHQWYFGRPYALYSYLNFFVILLNYFSIRKMAIKFSLNFLLAISDLQEHSLTYLRYQKTRCSIINCTILFLSFKVSYKNVDFLTLNRCIFWISRYDENVCGMHC